MITTLKYHFSNLKNRSPWKKTCLLVPVLDDLPCRNLAHPNIIDTLLIYNPYTDLYISCMHGVIAGSTSVYIGPTSNQCIVYFYV